MENKETIWDMAMEHAKKGRSHAQKKLDLSKELLMTFSNQKSLLSSKKIERFIIFITFITLTIIYIAKNLHEMDSMEFIEVIGIWLAYGGYNSFMNMKDKTINQSSEPTDPPSS